MHVPRHIRMQYRVSMGSLENVYRTDTKSQSTGSVTRWYHWGTHTVLGHAALIRSHMNGLQPLGSTIEETTETCPLTTKQYQLLTSRITSLRELLHYWVLENFVNHLYDRTISLTSVNERRELFFFKKTNKQTRSLASIPPTRVALVNHAKMAVFQGGFVLPQTRLKEPVWPCPSQGDDSLQAVSGYLTGQLFKKWKIHVIKSATAGVKQCVEHVASVLKQIWHAQVCATIHVGGDCNLDCPFETNNLTILTEETDQ